MRKTTWFTPKTIEMAQNAILMILSKFWRFFDINHRFYLSTSDVGCVSLFKNASKTFGKHLKRRMIMTKCEKPHDFLSNHQHGSKRDFCYFWALFGKFFDINHRFLLSAPDKNVFHGSKLLLRHLSSIPKDIQMCWNAKNCILYAKNDQNGSKRIFVIFEHFLEFLSG